MNVASVFFLNTQPFCVNVDSSFEIMISMLIYRYFIRVVFSFKFINDGRLSRSQRRSSMRIYKRWYLNQFVTLVSQGFLGLLLALLYNVSREILTN